MTQPELIAIVNCGDMMSFQKIWGVSLVERILRRLSDEGVTRALLIAQSDQDGRFRRDFKPRFTIATETITIDRLHEARIPESSHVLLLDGNAAYDNRLLKDVVATGSSVFITDDTKDSPLLVRLTAGEFHSLSLNSETPWKDTVQATMPHLVTRKVIDYSTYDGVLKSHTVPLLRRVKSKTELRVLERYVSRSQSKVVLDFVAIFLDKTFTWILVKPLSKTWITPNMLTWLIIAIQIVVIPVFFFRWIALGLVLEWIMIILDSCDGKLARLTIRQSEKLGWIEHRTSYVSTSLWYAAIGFHLGNYEIHSSFFLAGIAFFFFFWLDRKTVLAFLRTCGRSVYSFSPLDIRISYIIARRNITIFILTVAMLQGQFELGYVIAVTWTMASWVFHLLRLLYQARKDGRPITMKKRA